MAEQGGKAQPNQQQKGGKKKGKKGRKNYAIENSKRNKRL